jgi:hypothetical protein
VPDNLSDIRLAIARNAGVDEIDKLMWFKNRQIEVRCLGAMSASQMLKR